MLQFIRSFQKDLKAAFEACRNELNDQKPARPSSEDQRVTLKEVADLFADSWVSDVSGLKPRCHFSLPLLSMTVLTMPLTTKRYRIQNVRLASSAYLTSTFSGGGIIGESCRAVLNSCPVLLDDFACFPPRDGFSLQLHSGPASHPSDFLQPRLRGHLL